MPSHYATLPIPLPVPMVHGSSSSAGGLPKHRTAHKGVSVAVLVELAKNVPEGETSNCEWRVNCMGNYQGIPVTGQEYMPS